MQTHLPRALRDSTLPWIASSFHQASAPRVGDSWHATYGNVRFFLWIDAGDPETGSRPSFDLRVHDLEREEEIAYWMLPTLEGAVWVAEGAWGIIHHLIRGAMARLK